MEYQTMIRERFKPRKLTGPVVGTFLTDRDEGGKTLINPGFERQMINLN
jgi:hypothetical protein